MNWNFRLNLLEKKKDAICCCGIPLIREVVRNNRLSYRVLGIPIWRRKSYIADLITRVNNTSDFDSSSLDNEIADYFSSISLSGSSRKTDAANIAILTTKLRDRGGGDMRMIVEMAKLLKGQYNIRLFVTDLARSIKSGGKLVNFFKEEFSISGISTFASDIKRQVKDLSEQIARHNPKVVFVFIRPTDVWGTGVLSILKRETNIKIVYVMHAGQRANIGVSFADILPQASIKWTRSCALERKMDRCITSAGVLSNGSGILDFHFSQEERDVLRKSLGIKKDQFLTLSGGEASKFFDSPTVSEYFNTIKLFLDRNKNVVHCILSDFSKRQKRVIASIFGDSESSSRLKLHKRTTEYKKFFAAADVFLDSFPMGGTYTMIDLMGIGTPYVVKINKEEPLLSFHEYQDPNYPYMYSTAKEYMEGAEFLLKHPEARARAVNMNREHYEHTFSAAACRALLNKIISNADDFNKIIEPYKGG